MASHCTAHTSAGPQAGSHAQSGRLNVRRFFFILLEHMLTLRRLARSIAIILQLLAYRLFVLPGGVRFSSLVSDSPGANAVNEQPIRMSDFRYLMAAIKALLIGYGSDLLFGEYVLRSLRRALCNSLILDCAVCDLRSSCITL